MIVIKDSEFVEECPVCGKKTVGDAVLVSLAGGEDGGVVRAKLFHLDCVNLVFYDGVVDGGESFLFQVF